MKSFLVRLLIFGMLGAFNAIAIAWWFALGTTLQGAPRFSTANAANMFGYDSPENGTVWLIGRNRSLGVMEQNVGRAAAGDDNIVEVRVERMLQSDEVSAWSITRRRASPNDLPHRCIEQAFGWPLLCMKKSHEIDPDTGRWSSTRALTVPRQWRRLSSGRHVPLQPIWTAFVASTALYGWLWFAVLAFPLLARRRLRMWRGCCANCGYNRRAAASETCPECGAVASR